MHSIECPASCFRCTPTTSILIYALKNTKPSWPLRWRCVALVDAKSVQDFWKVHNAGSMFSGCLFSVFWYQFSVPVSGECVIGLRLNIFVTVWEDRSTLNKLWEEGQKMQDLTMTDQVAGGRHRRTWQWHVYLWPRFVLCFCFVCHVTFSVVFMRNRMTWLF